MCPFCLLRTWTVVTVCLTSNPKLTLVWNWCDWWFDWFSFLFSPQEPISETAAFLLCYPGLCSVWGYGALLSHGGIPHSVRHVIKHLFFYSFHLFFLFFRPSCPPVPVNHLWDRNSILTSSCQLTSMFWQRHSITPTTTIILSFYVPFFPKEKFYVRSQLWFGQCLNKWLG